MRSRPQWVPSDGLEPSRPASWAFGTSGARLLAGTLRRKELGRASTSPNWRSSRPRYQSRTSRARWTESGPLELPPRGEAQVNKLIVTVQADVDLVKADHPKIKDDLLFNAANQQSKAPGLNECTRLDLAALARISIAAIEDTWRRTSPSRRDCGGRPHDVLRCRRLRVLVGMSSVAPTQSRLTGRTGRAFGAWRPELRAKVVRLSCRPQSPHMDG
jgi:hypothetical protein